jgi:DNA/RNA endonuclease YhcR with UshA esterase domain
MTISRSPTTVQETEGLEHLEVIERDECLNLLEARGIGRVGASTRCRPVVYPVNYTVQDGTILFRTREGGDLDHATDDAIVAFEIDSADFTYHEGWSVLVVGRSSHVGGTDVLDVYEAAQRLLPWAGAERSVIVCIELDEVSGRRISHRAD